MSDVEYWSLDELYGYIGSLLKENLGLRERVGFLEKLVDYLLNRIRCLELLVYLYRNNLLEEAHGFIMGEKRAVELGKELGEDILYNVIACREHIINEIKQREKQSV